jgi:hypothetical protein
MKSINSPHIHGLPFIDCGLGDVISLIVADSVTASTFFADRSIDWVHLDARHHHAHVPADITAWLPKLKLEGGCLATTTMRLSGLTS